MRLPEDKRDRTKILLLLALLVGGAFYGVWAFVYHPLVTGRAEALTRRDQLEQELHAARVHIRRMEEMRREMQQVARNLRARSEYDMIHPRLGNYLLEARETVQRHGRAAGVDQIRVTELDFVHPPRRPDNEPPPRIRGYAVRVTAECSYAQLTHWLELLEEHNALLSVSQLQIAAQPDNPRKHQVGFEVQWPVWINPETRTTVRERVAATLQTEGPP